MFSILVSELTPEILQKAECWAIVSPHMRSGKSWPFKVVHASEDLTHSEYGFLFSIDDDGGYPDDWRCFPVSLAPDGTETRLECPKMPGEVEIEGVPAGTIASKDFQADWRHDGRWNWFQAAEGGRLLLTNCYTAPTPSHYPRLTCDGVWVWSDRR